MSSEDLKREYERKLQKIHELETERALYPGRGEPVPQRIAHLLTMLRIEAEELRMWGHRELVRTIQEGE